MKKVHLKDEGTDPRGLRVFALPGGRAYVGAKIVDAEDLGEVTRLPDGHMHFRGMTFSAGDWGIVQKMVGIAATPEQTGAAKGKKVRHGASASNNTAAGAADA